MYGIIQVVIYIASQPTEHSIGQWQSICIYAKCGRCYGTIKTQTKGFDEKYIETMNKIPIVVLQNQGSASASEVLSGALKAGDALHLLGLRALEKGLYKNLGSFPMAASLNYQPING